MLYRNWCAPVLFRYTSDNASTFLPGIQNLDRVRVGLLPIHSMELSRLLGCLPSLGVGPYELSVRASASRFSGKRLYTLTIMWFPNFALANQIPRPILDNTLRSLADPVSFPPTQDPDPHLLQGVGAKSPMR